MKKVVVLLCLVGFGLVTTLAQATDLKITCTGPTAYDDAAKTPIPAGKVITYQLYGGLQGQPKLKLPDAFGPVCSFTRKNVSLGTQEYYLTATIDNVESVPSTLVSYVVTPPVPGAPSGVTVTVSITITTP
jgi:hypothetical protein